MNNDMQLRCEPDPTKAFKATPKTETAIHSGKSKLNHENLEPVQSKGADTEGIARFSARRDYKLVEAVSHQTQHGYCYEKLDEKVAKHLPLGKSGCQG